MNEQQKLRLARVRFLNARRLYVLAMRQAELAIALRKQKDWPALCRKQAE